ncbi:MAG: formate--tetrahydrofolate ligase [Aliidongia sp.]
MTGSLLALLKDALQPNLVQSLGGTPAFVHGGPFANIAHGCNSVLATEAALGLADYVRDRGRLRRRSGRREIPRHQMPRDRTGAGCDGRRGDDPRLKMHGGVARADLGAENVEAVKRGAANLDGMSVYAEIGLPVAVALNGSPPIRRPRRRLCGEIGAALGVGVHVATPWADGGAGALDLARGVVELAESAQQVPPALSGRAAAAGEDPHHLPRIYGAADIAPTPAVLKQLAALEAAGHGRLPVCMAKTQYSFSTIPICAARRSAISCRSARSVSRPAPAFVVVLCGEIVTMPGLPRHPAAEHIDVDAAGNIIGLS